MSYIDGFVIAVPTANREKFIGHASTFDAIFLEFGATRVLECWGDDVPEGKLTDFHRAVQAKQDETVVRASMKQGDSLGVNGTPTLFINGERISGALPEPELWLAIDRALREAGVQPPPQVADAEKKPAAPAQPAK